MAAQYSWAKHTHPDIVLRNLKPDEIGCLQRALKQMLRWDPHTGGKWCRASYLWNHLNVKERMPLLQPAHVHAAIAKCNKDRQLFYIWTEYDSTSSSIMDFEYQAVPGTYESSRHSREFQTADLLTRALCNALRIRFQRKPVSLMEFLLHCRDHIDNGSQSADILLTLQSDDRFTVFTIGEHQYVQAQDCRVYRKGMSRFSS